MYVLKLNVKFHFKRKIYHNFLFLILQGSDVNLPDKKLGEWQNYPPAKFFLTSFLFCTGQTALHRAIYHGYFDIALLLLSYGASFEMNDFKSKSPVQYCCKPKNYVTHQQSQIKEQLVFVQNAFPPHENHGFVFLLFFLFFSEILWKRFSFGVTIAILIWVWKIKRPNRTHTFWIVLQSKMYR